MLPFKPPHLEHSPIQSCHCSLRPHGSALRATVSPRQLEGPSGFTTLASSCIHLSSQWACALQWDSRCGVHAWARTCTPCGWRMHAAVSRWWPPLQRSQSCCKCIHGGVGVKHDGTAGVAVAVHLGRSGSSCGDGGAPLCGCSRAGLPLDSLLKCTAKDFTIVVRSPVIAQHQRQGRRGNGIAYGIRLEHKGHACAATRHAYNAMRPHAMRTTERKWFC